VNQNILKEISTYPTLGNLHGGGYLGVPTQDRVPYPYLPLRIPKDRVGYPR